jgi:acylphosphatase
VLVVAEGDEKGLAALLQFLQGGSPAAQVRRVSPEWSAASGEFDSFEVRF